MLRIFLILVLAGSAPLFLSGCGLVATQVNRAANLLTAPLRAVQTDSAPNAVADRA